MIIKSLTKIIDGNEYTINLEIGFNGTLQIIVRNKLGSWEPLGKFESAIKELFAIITPEIETKKKIFCDKCSGAGFIFNDIDDSSITMEAKKCRYCAGFGWIYR